MVLAAEELARAGVERAEQLSDTPGADAEREELHEARKAAVARWREEQREAERAKREALDDAMRAREVGARRRASAGNARRPGRESESTRGDREKKRAEERGGRSGARARRSAPRRRRAPEAARVKKKEREEREARNAARARRGGKLRRLREPPRRRAAEALIPKAVDVSAAEAKAERDRPRSARWQTAKKRREAATARDKALSERLERQKAAAEKLAARRRLAEGDPRRSPPTRIGSPAPPPRTPCGWRATRRTAGCSTRGRRCSTCSTGRRPRGPAG